MTKEEKKALKLKKKEEKKAAKEAKKQAKLDAKNKKNQKEAPKAEPKKEAPKAEPKKEAPKAEPKKEAPKAEPKKEEKPVNEKKEPSHNYHVSKRKEDGKWKVFNAGSDKVIKLFDTQKEAIDYASKLVESQDGTLTIHMVDGKIRKQDYSKK